MEVGIVGLPNVGKSTIFNILTKAGAEVANYPFCTIDPNIGIVSVPDERLDYLQSVYKPKKEKPIYATIKFFDIAGLVKGASKGEGLGNKFLSNIKQVDAIAEVVRTFSDKNIIHTSNKIDPLSDIEVINTELMLSDMEILNNNNIDIRPKLMMYNDDNEEEEKGVYEHPFVYKNFETLGQPICLGTFTQDLNSENFFGKTWDNLEITEKLLIIFKQIKQILISGIIPK